MEKFPQIVGWTPLHEAANHGREDVTRLLVKNGANLSARAVDGLTPLMDAVINDHLSVRNDKGQGKGEGEGKSIS